MKVLGGLSALADRYDGYVVDLWGVVHDGTAPYPGAAEALAALRGAGKRICFLSNAPRRSYVVAEQLTGFGIAPALYDGIVTSGEASWELLRDRTHPGFDTLGTRAFHLGLVRDRSVVEGLGIELLATPDGAEFILNTGPDPVTGRESVAPYEPAQHRAVDGGVRLAHLVNRPTPELDVAVGDQGGRHDRRLGVRR